MSLKSIIKVLGEAFKPHPERFTGPLSMIGQVNASPQNAAVIEAAETEAQKEPGEKKNG